MLLLPPPEHVLKGLPVGDVVGEDYGVGAPVVRRSDGPETFGSGRVLHIPSIDSAFYYSENQVCHYDREGEAVPRSGPAERCVDEEEFETGYEEQRAIVGEGDAVP